MATLSMTLRVPYTLSQEPCCCGLTKLVEGDPPPVGMVIDFHIRPRHAQGCVWLLDNGSGEGRVAMRVVETTGRDFLDDKIPVLGYRVELEPVSMTLEQLQELVHAPWFSESKWRAFNSPGAWG